MIQYKVEPVARHELDELLRDYVCSTCWGPLTFAWQPGKKWFAICNRCREDTTGYTSKRYAEKRVEESVQEAIEAEHNLREIFGLNQPKRSTGENLRDLGFEDKKEQS